jgi:glutamate/aspartate transport system substrate-binding protein
MKMKGVSTSMDKQQATIFAGVLMILLTGAFLGDAKGTEPPPATAARALSPPQGPTLKRILRQGIVKAGYIPTPGTFAFVDAKGDTVGYSIDICLQVVEGIRVALKRPDLSVLFRPLEPARRITLLKSGEIDIECGGNTNTQQRQREVDFSYTFFNTGVRFLVHKSFKVTSVSSLWRKRVAVAKGTTAQEVVTRLVQEQEVRPVVVAADDEGVRMVETGAADAYAQDDILLYGLIANSKLKDELAVAGNFLTVEPYAFMLPKGDVEFANLVDRTLLRLMRTGELEAIYAKWFTQGRLVVPMNVYMKENIRFPNRYGVP